MVVLSKASPSFRKIRTVNILINSIKNYNKDKKRVKEVIAFVKSQNGLAYAEQKMIEFQQEAIQLLQNFPDSDYKASLLLMVNYVIERKI